MIEENPPLDEPPTPTGLASLTRFEWTFLIGTLLVVLGILVALALSRGATPRGIASSLWEMRFTLLLAAPWVLIGLFSIWLEYKNPDEG